MKLHPWNFRNLCYTPWKFQCLYLRLVEIPHDFFLFTPVNSFSWHPLEFPQFFQKFHVLFFLKFSEKLVQTVTPTVIYISSFWWVVNILLQKFYTLSKKETLTQKAAFLSLLWTRPIDLWGNMLETLEKQRKYRWKEIVGGKHFICCSYLSIYFGMNIFC